jgi:hypothetical protein
VCHGVPAGRSAQRCGNTLKVPQSDSRLIVSVQAAPQNQQVMQAV